MRDSHVPPSVWQRLATTIGGVGFGRITLVLNDGAPCFDPPPVIAREWLLGASHEQRCPPAHIALDAAFIGLRRVLTEIGSGPVVVEIRHGLPHRVLQQTTAPSDS